MTLRTIPVPGPGTEDVVVATHGPHAGAVYTGTADGVIHRLRDGADGAHVEQVATTGGRPLGIEIAPDGRLLVCDAHRGLLWVDPETGEVEVLVDAADGFRGAPLLLCDNAALASDGAIWFSDSSTRFGLDDWRADLVQHTRTGRLLRRDPDGTLDVVLDGLGFANGVALSAAEDYVVVAETANRSVARRWLTGPRAGMRDQLCADLPGYPDNLSRGSDGLIWVALPSPTVPLLERLQTAPLRLRKLASRLPERLQPAPTRAVRVQAWDDDGRLVHDLDLDAAEFHMVTGVREHQGRVWLGSLVDAAVAVVDL